ncbi:2-oxoglutarate dehydrogenase E1 component [Desertibaculum subflavum]|uniref:2-oxoglutarate dehydrogenase E1 component n=1 Tax=Desertibaculum subflavum TaxID=2268458 RepID=UPI003F670072
MPRWRTMTSALEGTQFLYGPNSGFIEELYARFLANPGSVDPSWQAFFAGLGREEAPRGPSWGLKNGYHALAEDGLAGAGGLADKSAKRAQAAGVEDIRAAALDSIRAYMLIRTYRIRGHLKADLDPLGFDKMDHPELDPAAYGFTAADMDRPIYIGNIMPGLETATIREMLALLTRAYCSTIGVEYMHIYHTEQRRWIQERMEGRDKEVHFTPEGKRAILRKLIEAEAFERFCGVKFTATKRFGLDGGEALIPSLEAIVKTGGQLGIREIILGMPHRGRLNVLANFMSKPFRAIFSEFQGGAAHPEDIEGSGDVKYHLGTSSDREFDGNKVHLSLTANPSHLEAVDPVCLGKARAKQQQIGDTERSQVITVLMHGDAAFAGQGLVAECFALSDLRGYGTGGTLHFIVNNQIGFTTAPKYSRSSPYPSDSAKMVQSPIFHANGDDPEAVVHVTKLATEFRQMFKKDVVVDMFCYRRHGHNEADEPSFTQPLMYRQIAKQRPTREIYAEKLVAEGVMTAGDVEAMQAEVNAVLNTEFDAAKSYKPNKADWLEGRWSGFEVASGGKRAGDTAVSLDKLREVGRKLVDVPKDFNLHRTLRRLMDQKGKAIETGEGIDWSTGEALAFGTLLAEGTPVRLSGQDSGRGTFSQRHAVLVDQQTEARYLPLEHVSDKQASIEVIDSLLSEAAVLGFEYGYTMAEPNALVLWEAQFGDFANGAQVIIDQFIASAESKWQRMSGLVLLLPHGYEGAGPEHSSARLERFLQLCAEDNMQVCNLTTPANYFHALRRQIHRKFRKPLVIMTPKSLLRHKLAVSKLSEMGPGSTFHRVLWDDAPPKDPKKVKRVILCSGKVYYDLFEERAQRGLTDAVILRIEQLYPFPTDALVQELKPYAHVDRVIWCQEEPKNMGAWFSVEPEIERTLDEAGFKKAKRPVYAGRAAAASPATGLHAKHVKQQKQLVDEALVG